MEAWRRANQQRRDALNPFRPHLNDRTRAGWLTRCIALGLAPRKGATKRELFDTYLAAGGTGNAATDCGKL
jgi:hypothetical protein